jgi:hypothetical protein
MLDFLWSIPVALWFLIGAVSISVFFALNQLRRAGLKWSDVFSPGVRGIAVPGIHVAKHAVGAGFMGIFLLVVYTLGRSATCISGRDNEGNLAFDLSRSGCTTELYGGFLVLTEWQNGLGAALGILGVGYAALLAAIMAESVIANGQRSTRSLSSRTKSYTKRAR